MIIRITKAEKIISKASNHNRKYGEWRNITNAYLDEAVIKDDREVDVHELVGETEREARLGTSTK